MNENANNENTVTGKAMGNILSLSLSALMLGGGAYLGVGAVGKVVKGVSKKAGKIKHAGDIQRAIKKEIKKPSTETLYHQGIQNRPPKMERAERKIMDQEAAKRTVLNSQRNAENIDVLNDDLFNTIGEESGAAIQTSLLEDKGGGKLGGIVDEVELNMKDIRSTPKVEAQNTSKNNNLEGQLSMFDNDYGNIDKRVAEIKQSAKEFTDSIMPPRTSPGNMIPEKPVTGNGGNNIFSGKAPVEKPTYQTESVFSNGGRKVVNETPHRKVKRGRGTKITEDLNNPYSGVNMSDYTKQGNIKKSVLNGQQQDVHQYIKPGSINYKDYASKPTVTGFDRKSTPGYKGDKTPSWANNINRPTVTGFDRRSAPGYRGDKTPSWVNNINK